MSGELTTKIRLVRCPKCRLVLPELPHYNVYKCGGCGTTLQGNKSRHSLILLFKFYPQNEKRCLSSEVLAFALYKHKKIMCLG